MADGPFAAEMLLELSSYVMQRVAGHRTLDAAATEVIEEICVRLGWSLGLLYLAPEGEEALVASGVWHIDDAERRRPFVEAATGTRLGLGECVSGQAARLGRPVSVADVGEQLHLPLAAAAREAGLAGAYAFPIEAAGYLEGVLAFYDEAPAVHDPVMLETIGACASLLGVVASSERVQEDLRGQNDRLHLVLGASEEAVVVADPSGRIVAANRRAEELYGWSEDELVGRRVLDTIVPGSALNEVIGIAQGVFSRDPPYPVITTTGLRRDGTTFPVELMLRPLILGDQRFIYGFIRDASGTDVLPEGTTVDVTEGRVGSPSSASLQRQAMDLESRLSASGVVDEPRLTEREREILMLLRDGQDVRAIARSLAISVHTVRGHLKHARRKLGVQTQLQAVVRASALGLLPRL